LYVDKTKIVLGYFLAHIRRKIENLINVFRFVSRFNDCLICSPLELNLSNLDNVHISEKVIIRANSMLRILDDCQLYVGEGTYISPYCHISGAKNRIIIGRGVMIGDRVFISSSHHRYDDITKHIDRQGFTSKGDVVIGDGCFIGIGSCILSGVNIGEHSIVGANSVVTHNIPSYSVAAGNPARVIKQYDFVEKKWLSKDKAYAI